MSQKVIKTASITNRGRINLNENISTLFEAVTPSVQRLVATGAVTAGVKVLELNHATVAIAATMASAVNHPGFFAVVNTSASGTAAHTLTITTGSFNGTNKVVTLNAPSEAALIYFDAAGRGTVVGIWGTAVFSG